MASMTQVSDSRPLVAMVLDAASGYGRDILQGAMQYANTKRRWLIHEEFRHLVDAPLSDWPACDGAIIAGVDQSIVNTVAKRCKHVVHCSGSGDPTQTHVVCVDDFEVGRMAAEHLMQCRLQTFGFLGLVKSRVAQRRYEGFTKALEARGYACIEAGVGWPAAEGLLAEDALPQVKQWLERLPKPAGIFAADDSLAHELAAICMKLDISVPDRLAVIGVNNDELLCESAWPPLSSVAAHYARVGFAAAELLDHILDGERPPRQRVELPPLGVARRLSTEVLVVNNEKLAECVRFIREHACDPCSVNDLVQHLKVNRRWLERQFHAELGRSLHEEIMRIRIETAERLLLQTQLPLPVIADRCGFAANQNFGRAFLNARQITPAAYRRQNSANKS